MARIIALIYNSWSLYAGLAILSRHTEAATSRPLMLHGIARRTSHNNRTTLTLTMTSNHAQAGAVRKALEAVSQLLQRVAQTAEQLTVSARWRQLLRFIFRDWLKTRAPDPPWLLSMGLTDSRI
jgi:hypothetical protein